MNNMTTPPKSITIAPLVEISIVLYLILRSGAAIVIAQGERSNFFDIGLIMFLLLYILIHRTQIHVEAILFIAFFVTLVSFTFFINNDSRPITYVVTASRLIVTLLIAQCLPFDKYRKYFVAIISTLAIFSLGFNLLQPFFSDYYTRAPVIILSYIHYHNWGVWLYRLDGSVRNTGIFWEPGAFQVFLNLALIFVLFDLEINKKLKLLSATALTLAVYTTYSTTGYIVLFLIFVAYLLAYHANNLSLSNIAIIIIGILIIILLFYIFVVQNPVISDKLNIEETLGNSFQSRINGLDLDLDLIKSSPITGVGSANYQKYQAEQPGYYDRVTRSTTSSTYTSIGAVFGLPIMFTFFFFQAKLIWHISLRKITPFIVVLAALVLMFSTEGFIRFLLFYILFWYGFLAESVIKTRKI